MKTLSKFIILISLLIISLTMMTACGQHTVTFMNGDQHISTQTIADNQVIIPQLESKQGYVFVGWYVNDVLFTTNTDIRKDTTVLAKWSPSVCVVTFDSNGGSNINNLTTQYNTSITLPTEPTRKGACFVGWYLGDMPFTNTSIITEHITVVAKWAYNVDFDINYSNSNSEHDKEDFINPQTVKDGEYLTIPTSPTRDGHNFVGWFTTNTADHYTEWRFDTMSPQENMTLYAGWEVAECDMPTVRITTKGRTAVTSKEEYIDMHLDVYSPNTITDLADIDGRIRCRGNSTFLQEKKPYKIKLDNATNLLGLHNGEPYKDWVLLADHYDYSLSRNYINFFIGSRLDVYCSDYIHVEVYINGQYKGVYLLCEQQEINEGRIDIERYDANDSVKLDTGYMLENDYNYYLNEDYVIENNINGKVSNYTHYIVKGDTIHESQLQYITEYMQDVYDAIFAGGTRAEIEALVDIDSAVEMHILQLINVDTDMNSSFVVYKDAGGKLTFGAPWDADMAYGNLEHGKRTTSTHANHLFKGLENNDWYMELLQDRYSQLMSNGLEEDIINELKALPIRYAQEFERNFDTYDILGTKNFPHLTDEVLDFEDQGDASDYLITFLQARFDFLTNVYFA